MKTLILITALSYSLFSYADSNPCLSWKDFNYAVETSHPCLLDYSEEDIEKKARFSYILTVSKDISPNLISVLNLYRQSRNRACFDKCHRTHPVVFDTDTGEKVVIEKYERDSACYDLCVENNFVGVDEAN